MWGECMDDFPKQPSCGRKSSTMMKRTLRLGCVIEEGASGVGVAGSWQVESVFAGASLSDALAVFSVPFVGSVTLLTVSDEVGCLSSVAGRVGASCCSPDFSGVVAAFTSDNGTAANSSKMPRDKVRGEDKGCIAFRWVKMGVARENGVTTRSSTQEWSIWRGFRIQHGDR